MQIHVSPDDGLPVYKQIFNQVKYLVASGVLASGQEALARLFASKRPEPEKFAGVQHTVHEGIPVIEGSIAWVGCTLEQLIPGGDHTIGIGAVIAAERATERDPLIWYRGEYR